VQVLESGPLTLVVDDGRVGALTEFTELTLYTIYQPQLTPSTIQF